MFSQPLSRRAVAGLLGGFISITGGCLRFQDSETQSQQSETQTQEAITGTIPVDRYEPLGDEIRSQSQQEFRREADKLVLKAGDKDATGDDLEGAMVAAEVTVGTTENRVDLSNVAQIVYTFRHRSDAPAETYADDLDTQDRSYLGIADKIYRIDRDSVEAAMAGYEEDIRGVMLNDFEDTGETTRTINVKDIDGGRNIGIGVEISSDFAQEVTLEVFSVRGKDTNGNEVFHLVTTEE